MYGATRNLKGKREPKPINEVREEKNRRIHKQIVKKLIGE
jgi:hypothetical protein